MNKLVVYLVLIFSFFACKDDTEPSKPVETFTEPENPAVADSSRWANVPGGLQAAYGTADKRYPKEHVPVVEGQNSWEVRAWRGERTHTQMVLWTAEDVNNVQVEVSGLTSKNDEKIAKSAMQTRFVRYVMTDEFAGGCGHRQKMDYVLPS